MNLSPEMSQTTGIKYVIPELGRRRNWNEREKKKNTQTRKGRETKRNVEKERPSESAG